MSANFNVSARARHERKLNVDVIGERLCKTIEFDGGDAEKVVRAREIVIPAFDRESTGGIHGRKIDGIIPDGIQGAINDFRSADHDRPA